MEKIIKLLMEHFKGDEAKVALWLETKNERLGNQTPLEMIKLGRTDKLLYFVITSVHANFKEGE